MTPFLTRPSLLAMLDHREAGAFSVAVPTVVVEEAINQYEKHLRQRPERGPEELAREGEGDAPPPGSREWIDRYAQALKQRLDELGIPILDEPSHDEIERWRAQGRKPFKANGVGNDGDARIWATALNFAEGQDIVLVSRNHKDFGDDESTLAAELCGDLERRKLSGNRVVLRPSIVHALGDLGAPRVNRAAAADLLHRGKGKRRLLDAAERVTTGGLLDDESAELLSLGVELDPETVYVDSFAPRDPRVNAAVRAGDVIAVEASVFGVVGVDVLVYRADAYGLSEDSPIHIRDYDFNESYAEGYATLDVEVVLETTVDGDRDVSSPVILGARAA